MPHKFLKYTFVIVSLLFSTISFSQTEQDIISEANRLGVNSREKAIKELSARGISESQAKEMAQLRGIDFDTFLDDYLKNNKVSSKAAKATVSNDVVTDLKVTSAPVVVSVPTPPKVVVEKDIKNYFGYDIFVNNPFGQKEYLLGNIDEGYILAPGDELRITVFGDNNLEFVSKIDLNGNISFPNLGVFFAAGNSFATVKNRLKIFLGKYYSGLLSSPNRTFLDVSLTQIRPVKVSVLGNVTTPGPHLVNGLATVLNALYASGGISTSGTLRDVKVYRNNKLIKTIDLYDYITQGNIDQDIRLANNDILFVKSLIGDTDISDGGGWANATKSVGDGSGSDEILQNIITEYGATGTICAKQTPKEKNDKQKIGFGIGIAVCGLALLSVPLSGGASAGTAAMTIGMMAPGIAKDGADATKGPEELPDECKKI